MAGGEVKARTLPPSFLPYPRPQASAIDMPPHPPFAAQPDIPALPLFAQQAPHHPDELLDGHALPPHLLPRAAVNTMVDSDSRLWLAILVLTAFLLSSVVLVQVLTTYTSAYIAAPHEINTFKDAVESSKYENESYNRDIDKVQSMPDKMRLTRLLRDIQKAGDDLLEHLNRLTTKENGSLLRPNARLLWASHRPQLEERVRRMDLIRMRFLVLYFGILAAQAPTEKAPLPKDPEKPVPFMPVTPRSLPKSLSEAILKKPPLRKISTTPVTPNEKQNANDSAKENPRAGWMGVVAELQKSPLMQKRHASIENAMSKASIRLPSKSASP